MSDTPKMTMGQAFDEWLRMNIEHPEKFQNALACVKSHDIQSDEPGVTEYGRDCQLILEGLMSKGADFWNAGGSDPECLS